MRKFIIAGAMLTALVVPSIASADVSTNGTTRDAQGYCIANHIANFNGGNNGIGHLRSEQTGKAISSQSGNRAPAEPCIGTQGDYAPISS